MMVMRVSPEFHLGRIIQPIGPYVFYIYFPKDTRVSDGHYFRGTLLEAFAHVERLAKSS